MLLLFKGKAAKETIPPILFLFLQLDKNNLLTDVVSHTIVYILNC